MSGLVTVARTWAWSAEEGRDGSGETRGALAFLAPLVIYYLVI